MGKGYSKERYFDDCKGDSDANNPFFHGLITFIHLFQEKVVLLIGRKVSEEWLIVSSLHGGSLSKSPQFLEEEFKVDFYSGPWEI